MQMLRLKGFIKRLLQGFGILRINDGLNHYSFNKPWYRSSEYYRYVWRRCTGKAQEQTFSKESKNPADREKEAVPHIIKQP